MHVLPCREWVDVPATLGPSEQQLDGGTKHTAFRWPQIIGTLAEVHDYQRGAVDARRDQERDPEADVTLAVEHV